MMSRQTMGKRLLGMAAGLVMAGAAQAQQPQQPQPQPQQQVLKLAHVFEVSEPFHTESVWAAGEIGKRTGGRYRIEVYPASSLGKEIELDQGLTLGTVDMVVLSAGLGARQYPPIGVTYYPFTFRNADHLLAYTKSDVFRELVRGYEDKVGHHIVAVTYYGTRHTTSNRPIASCADLKGVKMRVPSIPAYLAMPKACGANPAPIAFAELYLALQNGTVDAQENPFTAIDAKKLYEVQKHIALTGHIVDQLNTMVSRTRWAKLSDADKAVFTEVLQEAAARASRKVVDDEERLARFFRQKGLTITEVDQSGFLAAVQKNVKFEELGYRKADWDRIQAIR